MNREELIEKFLKNINNQIPTDGQNSVCCTDGINSQACRFYRTPGHCVLFNYKITKRSRLNVCKAIIKL